MIELPESLLTVIIRHAREAYPQEACGILGGRFLSGNDGIRVKEVSPLRNVAETPETTYLMDPREQFQTLKTLKRQGWVIVGIYHSHPGSEAYPSPTDLALAYDQLLHYLVVSLARREDPEARSFTIRDQKFFEEEILCLK